jgi:16S rRNA (guanine966-N2)-methyltransferase
LRSNIAACKATGRGEVVACDMLNIGPGKAATLIFLDPPYGQALVPRALARLRECGRVAPDALIVAEMGRDETWAPDCEVLAERAHGVARVVVFRA